MGSWTSAALFVVDCGGNAGNPWAEVTSSWIIVGSSGDRLSSTSSFVDEKQEAGRE